MRTGFFLGWAAIIAIITGLIVFAILDYNSEGKAARTDREPERGNGEKRQRGEVVVGTGFEPVKA